MKTVAILTLLAALVGGASAQTAEPSAGAGSAAKAAGGSAPYRVVDGYKVDPATLEGFRAWRAAACDRCHGAEQEGAVGPSLIAGLKRLSKEKFVDIVTNGRNARGLMPAYKANATVMDNMDGLYSYLKGRSDGAITQAKVEAIDK